MKCINKKLFIHIITIFILVIVLVGCSKKNSKTIETVDSERDIPTKVAIVVQPESENDIAYKSALSIFREKEYMAKNDKNTKTEVELFTLPKNFENNKSETNKIFEKLLKDKNINVAIFSANRKGLLKYAEKIKKERKDIITISANLAENEENLIRTFDLNFKSRYSNRGKKIVEMSKILGAEKFVTFISEDDKNDDEKINLYNEIKKYAKDMDISMIEISIPNDVNEVQKKSFLSNKIDELIRMYGNNINIYTFDSNLDKVLFSKIFNKKFIISEFSKPNVTKEMMNFYGLNYITRYSENYYWMNSEIIGYMNKNGFEKRIGSVSANSDSFVIRYATELGINLNAKGAKIKTAYNSYFLEKVSKVRCNVEAAFINRNNSIGNFKYIEPDQIVY